MPDFPCVGEFAKGEAEALAGEIGAAVPIEHDEATQLDDELEAVGTGHRVPADPGVAVLESFGGTTPAEDGDELVGAVFRILLVGSLPENVTGGPPGFQIVLLVEGGTKLADFEWFGGGADDDGGVSLKRWQMNARGVHNTPTMQKWADTFSQIITRSIS